MTPDAPSRERERERTVETETETVTVRGHYWERARHGALPLVLGALGLAGLGVGQLLPLRHSVESDLRVRSLSALGAAGLAGVEVDFAGQDGVLRGQVASAADVDRALQLVRGLDGVRVARSELTFPGSGSAPVTTPSPSAVPSATPSAVPSAVPSVTPSPTPSPSTVASPTPTPVPASATPTPAAPSPSAPAGPAPAVVNTKLAALPPVGFVFGSSTLTPAGRATVTRMAAVLKADPSLKITVNGYTDDIGDWDRNMTLSKARAAAVREGLIANGIPASRVTSAGWSEERPKVPNTSAANRAINRRVEVVAS